MAGDVVSAIVAFAMEFGETAVAAGLGEAGAGEVMAATFAGGMAGEAPDDGLLADDAGDRTGLGGVGLAAGAPFCFAGEMAGEAPCVGLLTAGAGDAGAPGEPEAVGLAAGPVSSVSTGALFPIFAKSGPNLILPSIMGRSKR